MAVAENFCRQVHFDLGHVQYLGQSRETGFVDDNHVDVKSTQCIASMRSTIESLSSKSIVHIRLDCFIDYGADEDSDKRPSLFDVKPCKLYFLFLCTH